MVVFILQLCGIPKPEFTTVNVHSASDSFQFTTLKVNVSGIIFVSFKFFEFANSLYKDAALVICKP